MLLLKLKCNRIIGSQQSIVRTGSLILLRLWSKAKICEVAEYCPEGCDVKREEKRVKSLVQIMFSYSPALVASPRVTRDFANSRVSLGHLPQIKKRD